MGAICKTIDIHNDIQPVLAYTTDKTKTDLGGLDDLFRYVENPEKTTLDDEETILVSGVKCTPETAAFEFEISKNKYREKHPEHLADFDLLDKPTGELKHIQKTPVTAVHLIQSFDDEGLDPTLAHEIGVELAERLEAQAVVSTHINKKHVHNHVVINSYMPDGKKFASNLENRMMIRNLSDNLLREYGLDVSFASPEEQLQLSKGAITHHEWKVAREGKSWKDELKQTIIQAYQTAQNKEGYLQLMNNAGYSIEKQNAQKIMWNTPDGKRIWDKTLGPDFAVGSLYSAEPKTKRIPYQPTTYHAYKPTISISRYEWDGRKRTEIELLLRRAIWIIQKIGKYLEKIKQPQKKKYDLNYKLRLLSEALKTFEKYGLKSKDEISQKVTELGRNLAEKKRDIKFCEQKVEQNNFLQTLIREYQNAKTLYDSVNHWETSHNLFLEEPSKEKIRENKAKLTPLSPKEKIELFSLLERFPNYRISNPGKQYCNVSTVEFNEIKQFLQGKSLQKPETLISIAEANRETAYRKLYNKLQNTNTPPSKKQTEEALNLLKDKGYNVSPESLCFADIINIKNCFGKIPFTSPLISEEKQLTLSTLLEKANAKLNRDIKTITEDEYEEISLFLQKKNRKVPEVLKEYVPPKEEDKEEVQRLLFDSGLKLTVNLGLLNKNQINSVKQHLLSRDQTPFCLQENLTETKDKAFHDNISNETERKQQVLISFRNATKALLQFGINPNDILQTLLEFDKEKKNLEELKKEQERLTVEYRKVQRANQQIRNSQSVGFCYGQVFTKKELKDILEEDNKAFAAASQQKEAELEEEIPRERELEKKHKHSHGLEL